MGELDHNDRMERAVHVLITVSVLTNLRYVIVQQRSKPVLQVHIELFIISQIADSGLLM